MPKVKTNRSAAKRFRRTSSGQVKRSKAYRSHILTKKTRQRKRKLRKAGLVHDHDLARVRRLVPYA